MKRSIQAWLLLMLLGQAAMAQPLMDKITTEAPQPKMFKYAEIRTWSFTLPNGVLLVMRPDDSAKNIVISGFANGGAAGMPAGDYASAINAGQIIARSGLGKYDAAALAEQLKGKDIHLTASIADNSSAISGTCSKEDFETALQLIYLYFTAPRKDAEACRQYIQLLKDHAGEQQHSVLEDTLTALRYGADPRHNRDMAREAANISIDKVFAAWDKCFGNARGYTFVITGDLNPNSMNHSKLEPLADRYLAALPAKDKAERPPMEGITLPKATIERTVHAGHDSLAYGSIIFGTDFTYSDSANLQFKALSWIFRQYWVDAVKDAGLRLKGVNTGTRTDKLPQSRYEFRLNFICPAAQAGAMTRLLHEAMDSLQSTIPADYLKRFTESSKEMLKKQFFDNGFWTTYLIRQFMKEDDPYDIAHYPYFFRKATPETVREAARLLWHGKPYTQVVVLPEGQIIH